MTVPEVTIGVGISEPGFFELDADSYLRDPCPAPSLNNSLIRDVLECPALAREHHPKLNPLCQPKEPSARQLLGSLAHKLLLERGADIEMIDAKDYRTNAAKDARDTAILAGKLPALPHQLQSAAEMVAAIEAQLHGFQGLAVSDFKLGKKEIALVWQENVSRETPVWCRNLIDWLRDDLPQWEVWDYKTTETSVNPESMALSIHFVEMGYATQCAMQERGLVALFPQLAGRIKFRRLFQSVDPPYLISVVEPDPATMTIAHKQVDRAIEIWSECLASGEWPGYPRKVVTLRHAEHLAARWLEREIADHDAGRLPPPPNPDLARMPGRPRGKYSRMGKRILTPRDQTIIDAG